MRFTPFLNQPSASRQEKGKMLRRTSSIKQTLTSQHFLKAVKSPMLAAMLDAR
jgi:hypothetical protein